MKIAEIAPPWVRVPPERYGGIEWVVSILTDDLVDRGHDVTRAASEIVRDGEVGVLLGAGEWDEMAAAIKGGRLEDRDPHHCREYVEEHFSVEAMINGYEAAFEKIVADRAESESSLGNAPSGDLAR